jgi:hypothetical protein
VSSRSELAEDALAWSIAALSVDAALEFRDVPTEQGDGQLIPWS